MTFEISFPQMTHDGLSAVKIKQTLYGSHRAVRLGNKEHKWCIWVHTCMCSYTCVRTDASERNLLSEMSEPQSGQTLRFPVERYFHQSTYTIKTGAPNSYPQKHQCHLEPPFSLCRHPVIFLSSLVPVSRAEPKPWRCGVDLVFRKIKYKGQTLNESLHFM